jgi:hypothetical protein
MSEREYVCMWPNGELFVEPLLILLFMQEAELEFEVLGFL